MLILIILVTPLYFSQPIKIVPNNYMYRFLFLILTFLIASDIAKAQERTFNYSVELKTLAATEGELPFWLYANQWGEVDPSGANAILNAGITKTFFRDSDRWDLELGAELTSRYSKNSAAFFKQLYAKLDYGILKLEIGRFEDITGNIFKPLSMGSMSFSGNATPLPKIKLSIPEYQSVPFTDGYLEIKGAWGHGWMEEERYTSRALLHEKYGYVRIGGDLPVNLIGGMQHWVFWGGNNREFGPIPQTFEDYLNIAFALGAGGEDAPPRGQAYFLGDHKGYWDFGAEIDIDPFLIRLYKQTILEDKDNVKLKNPQDGLYGLAIESKEEGNLIEAVIWEFLYTKWQSGPSCPGCGPRGGSGGQDNYYNNSTYRTGWTYFGRTIGTPLLFPRNDGLGIANNRVVAHHLGLTGKLSDIQDYNIMFTYSRNYGTYETPIDPRMDSYSVVAMTGYQPAGWDNLSFNAGLAADFGELYGQNVGMMIGIKWQSKK